MAARKARPFYAVRADGTIKWRFEGAGSMYSSPVIAKDGTVYMGCCGHKPYAFAGSAVPAVSPWPMFCANPRRTGRREAESARPTEKAATKR